MSHLKLIITSYANIWLILRLQYFPFISLYMIFGVAGFSSANIIIELIINIKSKVRTGWLCVLVSTLIRDSAGGPGAVNRSWLC